MGRGFFSPLPFLLLLFDFPVFAVLGLIGDYFLSLSLPSGSSADSGELKILVVLSIFGTSSAVDQRHLP